MTDAGPGNGSSGALRASLAAQLAELRGVAVADLPASLLDVSVRRVELPGGDAFLLRPADWEALRHDEGAAGRPVPWWARLWPSGRALAATLARRPPDAGTRVLELGCGLALPSLVAARAGAEVLATDGATDAVAYAAHGLALNEVEATVAHADWDTHGDRLTDGGPWDLVLAADVFYARANVDAGVRLLPRLVAARGAFVLADPGRAGTRDFLAAARGRFELSTRRDGDVALHTLRPR